MRSPAIQTLIDKGLFDRIPATFSTFFFDQIQEWDTLFPAERSYFERLFALVDHLGPEEFEELFRGLREVEQKMGVNNRNWPRRTFTLDQVDFLNRNPHYAEWRGVITGIFARLDPVLEADVARRGRPRVSVVISPAELPVGPDKLWTRLKGRRVTLSEPFEPGAHLTPLLKAGAAAPYDRWLIQTGKEIAAPAGVVSLSYEELAPYRARLSEQVQQVVEKEQLRGPRELGVRLRKMKLLPGEGQFATDAPLSEFARAVLLAGNGTLLINNTFVEWASVLGVRRARPSLLVSHFGIRNKLKPFSSMLIYADQEKVNPMPTQIDTLGTYVDLELLYLYVWQEFEKYAEYKRNTVHVFVASGMDEALVIAPTDFTLAESTSPANLVTALTGWLHW